MNSNFFITLVIFTLLSLAACYPQNSHHNNDDEYNDEVYDPTTRDFTERCNDLAQYAGPKACEVFNKCCSTDFSLNKLNGDRCQTPDHRNQCTLASTGTGIGFSQCKAFNCTAEVTTTTTTMRTPRTGAAAGWGFSVTTVVLALGLLRL